MTIILCPKCNKPMNGSIKLRVTILDEEPAVGELGEEIMSDHYRCDVCKVYAFYKKGKTLSWDWFDDHED